MPRVGTAGPVTFDSSLAAYSDPSQDGPYTEQVIVSTENQPVTFSNLVQYQTTGGNAAQTMLSTV